MFPADSTVISRIHASVRWDVRSGRFMLQDEGSRNATFTEDGRRLDAGVPVALEPGATFCVGAANMRFRVRAD
jgi:pSer/pThr/pTyr-binding forkhead associated (FHA) protein